MIADFVQHLRDLAASCPFPKCIDCLAHLKAADAIERLTAERDVLERQHMLDAQAMASGSDGYYRTNCGLFMGFQWTRSDIYVVPKRFRLPKWARWCRKCVS
jgi:hypothetical protein